jgi:hypothetical protein
MKREHSLHVANIAASYAAKLNEALAELRQECSAEEVRLYEKGVAQILESLRNEVLEPIYAEHPDLRPKGPTAPH